jgi:drug/metabolite transporter (DMT)-like permease
MVLAPWFFLFCRKQILETGFTKVFGLAFLAGPLMVMLVVGGNTFASAASGIPVELTTFSISCLVLSSWLLRYRLTKLQLVGITALCLRIILISAPLISYYQTGASLGLLMCAAAGMMFAAFTVLVQRWRIEPFLAVTIVSVTGLCVYCPYYLLTQSADRLSQASSLLLFEQVLGQGLLAGIGAPTAFLVSAKLLGLDRAVLLSALTPAIAVICSAALNREVPTFGQAAILVVGAAGALLLAVGKTAATR